MRVVITRVLQASVVVNGQEVAQIGKGYLILAAWTNDSTILQNSWMVKKLLALRAFPQEDKPMHLTLSEVEGEILLVSQFTLYGNLSNGNRPSFIDSAPAPIAQPLYEDFLQKLTLRHTGKVASGIFGAHMQVSSINDGPVTFILDAQPK